MQVLRLDSEPVQRGELLYTWDGRLKTPKYGSIPARMVIAGYKVAETTCLVVISPLEPTRAVLNWIKGHGTPTFIVAPNKLHTNWAADMKMKLPGSLLIAPEGADPELPTDARLSPLAGGQDLPGSWPADVIDVIPVKGMPFLEELVFFHKPSSTLILTDLAFNFDKNDQDTSLLQWLYLLCCGGFRPCCVTTPFKWLIEPVGMKQSFDDILEHWEFDQVSMAHGLFIDSGGKKAFREGTYSFVTSLLKQHPTKMKDSSTKARPEAPEGEQQQQQQTSTLAKWCRITPSYAAAAAAALLATGVGVACWFLQIKQQQ